MKDFLKRGRDWSRC